MIKTYILVNNKPKMVSSFEEYINWEKENGIIVMQKEVLPGVKVSTVFLSFNHGSDDNPLLFETMVFGGIYDEYQKRYSTYEQAIDGFYQVCKMVLEEY
jgi:hypothetical protein